MACTNPLIAYYSEGCGSPRFIRNPATRDLSAFPPITIGHDEYHAIHIPCGRCPNCLQSRARDWTTRIYLESTLYPAESNWFLTLTYDDEHLPRNSFGTGILKPEHLQLFLKSLRKKLQRKYGWDHIRFYAAGEYGSKSFRPHYHLILMNCPLSLSDMKLHGNNSRGDALYISSEIASIWKYGFHLIAECTPQTIAYTARYCLKKAFGASERPTLADVPPESLNRLDEEFDGFSPILEFPPEFTRMSRRPGIGREYFDQNWEEIYQSDSIQLPNGDLRKPPKYFDRILSGMDYDLLLARKDSRSKLAQDVHQAQLIDLNYSEDEFLAVADRKSRQREGLFDSRRNLQIN